MKTNKYIRKIKVLYEIKKRDRDRLLKIKELHSNYHRKVDAVLNQIK